VANLTRRLYRLEAAISVAPPATPSAQGQIDELARYVSPSEICSNTLNLSYIFRRLDAVSDRLKKLRVNSVLGSKDIAQAILDCLREVDEQVQDYTVSRLFYKYGLCSIYQLHVQVLSLIRMEYIMQGLPRSVAQEMVFVRDATGREYKLLVDQCRSRKVSSVHQS